MRCVILLCLICMVMFSITTSSYAYTYSPFYVKVDGQELTYQETSMLINGLKVIPLIKTLEAMGVNYEVISDSLLKITNDDTSSYVRINSKLVYSEGEYLELDRPVYITNDIPMVSCDFFRKVLGGKVEWFEDKKQLNIFSKNELKVHFIDVGQGEAIFIDYGDYDILIDAGGEDTGLAVANYLINLGTDDVDLLVLTHPDKDHVGGLEEVLKHIDVEEIIHSKAETRKKVREGYIPLLKDGSLVKFYRSTDRTIDLGNDTYFHVMNMDGIYDNIDNKSVVTMLEHDNVKFLFTGDIEQEVELNNLEKFDDIDVLKVANHGLDTSTSKRFINKVAPSTAVISALENPYNEVTSLLSEKSIDTYITGEEGTIVINSDGNRFSVENKVTNGFYIKGIDFNNSKIMLKSLFYKDIDVSGYKIVDKRTEKEYYIVEDSILDPNKQRVYDLVENLDNPITSHNMFNTEKSTDYGTLYDSGGNFVTTNFGITKIKE